MYTVSVTFYNKARTKPDMYGYSYSWINPHASIKSSIVGSK